VSAEAIAEALEAGIQAERLRQRAPELERELAFTKAGIPLDKPYGRLFAEHYDGAVDPDDITASWHRTMLDTEPPQDVLQRIRSRDADRRIARYRQALEEETESAE
jgi:hypothetical protein